MDPSTVDLLRATWALVGVGLFTLVAAVVAAVASVRAYRLEATPGLAIAANWFAKDDPNMRRVEPYVVARDLDPAARSSDPAPAFTIRENRREDDLNGRPHGHIEIRNYGRSAIVEAELHVRTRTSEIDKTRDMDDLVRDVYGAGRIRISAIAANSAVALELFGPPAGCELVVDDATAILPGYGRRRRKKRRIPFVASTIHIGFDGTTDKLPPT